MASVTAYLNYFFIINGFFFRAFIAYIWPVSFFFANKTLPKEPAPNNFKILKDSNLTDSSDKFPKFTFSSSYYEIVVDVELFFTFIESTVDLFSFIVLSFD